MKKINLSTKFFNRRLNLLEFKLQRTKLISKPVYLTIEPTDACNSRCVMCNKRKLYASPEFKPGFMSREIFEKALPWVSYATSTCWGGFGEPFLHPHYGEWAEDLKQAGANLSCFTNGINLTRSLAEKLVDIQFDTIIISIGGATEHTYKSIRGVNGLKPMLKNLAYLNEVKRANNSIKPAISFNLVAMNTVLPQLIDIIRLAHKHEIQSVAMPDLDVQYEENIEESIWTDIERAKEHIEQASHIAKELGIGFCPPTLHEYAKNCRAFFSMIFVTYDGIVLSCSTERHILGDLKKNPLEKIWNNKAYQRIREKYFKEGVQSACPGCVEWDKSKHTMLTATVDLRNDLIALAKMEV